MLAHKFTKAKPLSLRFGHLSGEQALHIRIEKTGNMSTNREVRISIEVSQTSLVL